MILKFILQKKEEKITLHKHYKLLFIFKNPTTFKCNDNVEGLTKHWYNVLCIKLKAWLCKCQQPCVDVSIS